MDPRYTRFNIVIGASFRECWKDQHWNQTPLVKQITFPKQGSPRQWKSLKGVCWCTPLISTLLVQRHNSLLVQRQPGLHEEFQASHSYVVRSYLKKKQREIENNHQRYLLDSAEACYQQLTVTTPSACWHYFFGAVWFWLTKLSTAKAYFVPQLKIQMG